MDSESVNRGAFALLKQVCRVTEEQLIDAFGNTENRTIFFLPKRNGGKRKIVASHRAEKLVQTRLLRHFFTRLLKRHDHYYRPYDNHWRSVGTVEQERLAVLHQPAVARLFSNHIHGARLERNTKTALAVHTAETPQFVMKFDLRDAFGSVTTESLRNVLRQILLDEVSAYYKAYEERLLIVSEARTFMEQAKADWEKVAPHIQGRMPRFEITSTKKEVRRYFRWCAHVEKLISDKGFRYLLDRGLWRNFEAGDYNYLPIGKQALKGYPKHPLFPANSCPELRKLIQEAVFARKPIEETAIPQILDTFLDHVLQFVTHEGVLPQGSPTSGILLNLVISHGGVLEAIEEKFWRGSVSIYVDDLILTLRHRPDKSLFETVEKTILATGLFQPNRAKTKLYDLREGSAPVLGLKLNRRPVGKAGEDELRMIESAKGEQYHRPRGFAKAVRTGRPWMITTVTLPKKTQKKYRKILHQAVRFGCTREQLALANGYYGHIVSTYGWFHMLMPSSLRGVVLQFREKYHIPPLDKKRWNESSSVIMI